METLYSVIGNEKKYLDMANSKVILNTLIFYSDLPSLHFEIILKRKPEGEICDRNNRSKKIIIRCYWE